MINKLTKIIRTYFTGKDSHFVFKRAESLDYGEINKINLYIHIPFCNSLCPYCPYNKIEYDKNKKMVQPYLEAMLNEIEMIYNLFGEIDIPSIYIGGGTPTLLIDELSIIFQRLNRRFKIIGDICIETNPAEITDHKVDGLKENNISLVSVGVQSFQDKYLQFIGRKYHSSILDDAIEKLIKAKFKSINIDLIFALSDQTVKDVTYDLQKAIDIGVNQITTYPLFTFPYSSIGRYLKLKKVKMPNLIIRHKLYYHIHQYLLDKGFSRVSVWGFKRDDVPRYSSVTRDNYIGLGASAAFHMPNGFYLNTFSVEEYIKKCLSNKFPTALYMNFNKDMQNYFWLYWRLYDTYIPKKELFEKFSRNDKKLNQLLALFKGLQLIYETNDYFELTMQGAFWIHLLQNYFSLSYINKAWSIAMKEAYPEQIIL